MNFSPIELQEIKERTAQILAERIIEKVGDLDAYTVFPMSVASSVLGLSSKQIPVYLPVVSTAAGKKGVTLASIRQHIESRTASPTGLRARRETQTQLKSA
jgi:hypothetical protein